MFKLFFRLVVRKRGQDCVRGTEINNSPILLVFQLVFCVASKDTYLNMLPLMRLEYELKSCAIFVELFSSVPLIGVIDQG